MRFLNELKNKFIFGILLITHIKYVSGVRDIFLLIFSPGKCLTLNLEGGNKIQLANRLDLFTLEEIFEKGIYNIKSIKPRIIFDIGSNIGLFSIFISQKYPKAQIYAFEPNPSVFKVLKRNIEINKITQAHIYNAAIAKNSGRRLFYENKMTPASGFFKTGEIIGKKYVKTFTLAEIFIQYGIKSCDLLKIDCEGAEYEILMNLNKTLLKKIKNIIVEYHDSLTNYSYRDLVKLFLLNGFSVKRKVQQYDKTIGIIYAKNNTLLSPSL